MIFFARHQTFCYSELLSRKSSGHSRSKKLRNFGGLKRAALGSDPQNIPLTSTAPLASHADLLATRLAARRNLRRFPRHRWRLRLLPVPVAVHPSAEVTDGGIRIPSTKPGACLRPVSEGALVAYTGLFFVHGGDGLHVFKLRALPRRGVDLEEVETGILCFFTRTIRPLVGVQPAAGEPPLGKFERLPGAALDGICHADPEARELPSTPPDLVDRA